MIAAVERIDAIRETVAQAIVSAGPLGLDVATLDDYQREALAHLDDVAVEGRPSSTSSPRPTRSQIIPTSTTSRPRPFAPPAPDGVDRGELRELVRRGLVVERDGIWFAAARDRRGGRRRGACFAPQPDGITVSQIREALEHEPQVRDATRSRSSTRGE